MSFFSGEHADRFIVGLVVAQFKFSEQFLESSTYNVMYDKFFEILRETKSDACRAVIIFNFLDLDEFKQDDAVKRLLTMYEDNLELLTPFIETFTEMCISEETKARISSIVEHLLENNCAAELYPGIVKYLLYYTKSPEEIVDNLRRHLKWGDSAEVNWQSLKSKVFKLLEKAVRRQESKIADAWIKIIGALKTPQDLKPVDFVMLLLILSIKEDKFNAIKKVLCQKVPIGFFTSDFLENCFSTFASIIAQYSGILLEMLGALQKNNNYEINEFSSTCFKEHFALDSSDKKEIIGTLVQFLCEKTPQASFLPKSDFKMMTLNILGEIKKKQSSAEDLLLNYKILLRVLDHSKVKLTFNEHRLVMELLCSLTYMTNFSSNHHSLEKQKLEEERAALQEHLEMMVNKLMCNPDMKIKQLGIIGAVKIVSSLVSNVVLSSESLSNERISIDDIPNGLVKDAMQRMSFIIKSVGDNHHGFAMLCDEIALEFKLKENDCDINEVFLMWLSDIFFDQLKDLSVVPLEQTMPEIEGETLSHQLLVQTNDYSQPTLTIHLGSLVLYQKTDKVVYLSSLFYVTRLMLMIRYQNLTELIVFAIMPITLTENFATSEDELNESDEALAMQKLDLYFHCANCLREIIGTFTHYNDDEPELKKCVVKRVKQLVQVEKHLNRLLKQVPSGYYPPAATFLDIDAKKKAFEVLRKEKRAAGNPPKKMRKKNNATAIDVTPEETTNKLRQFCREIDTNVIVLLMEEFKFESDVGDDEFGLEELQFLLDDVYHKIAFKCSARSAEQRGFYNPVAVISQLNQCVTPYIVAIFKGIRGELITMSQKASDDVSDAVFFTKDANMLKNCFCLILQMLEVILSCPKLKLEKNKELLTETLKAILPPEEELSNVDSQDQLSLLIFEHYTSLGKYVRNCESAVALLEFLLTVGKFSPTTQKESVRDLSEMFLKKVWKDSVGGDAKGAKFNINVEKILKIHVEFIDLQTIEKLIGLMKSDLVKISVKTLDHHSTFPSFNKDNSHVMLRAYMARSSRILESTDPKQLTEKFWLKFTKVYNDFKETTNVFSSLFEATKKGVMAQKAYIIFLSNFLVYIKVFNMSSKPVLESVLKYPERFTKLVKSTQDITRYAHGLSCDLKVSFSIVKIIRVKLTFDSFHRVTKTLPSTRSYLNCVMHKPSTIK